MKNRKIIFLTICFSGALFFDACGSDSGNGAEADATAEVKTIHGLGECQSANEGVTKLVTSEDVYYTCSDGFWKTEGSSDSRSENGGLSDGNSRNEGISQIGKEDNGLTGATSRELEISSSSSFVDGTLEISPNKSSESNKVCEGSEYDADAQTLKDCRDGKVYRTVQIGNQIWMAEDLVSYSEKVKQYSAKDLCPSGWHLPNNDEWVELINTVGEVRFAGALLKSTESVGVDKYGFSATLLSNRPWGIGMMGLWGVFLGTEGELILSFEDYAVVEAFRCGYNDADIAENFSEDQVRCLKGDYPGASLKKLLCDINPEDSSEYDPEKNILRDLRDGQMYRTVNIGGRVWMAENLNYVDVNHGSCSNLAICAKYGALYTKEDWSCPKGWEVPDTTAWKSLIAATSGASLDFHGTLAGHLMDSARVAMELKATSGWPPDYNGLDAYGFSAIPQNETNDVAIFWGKRATVSISNKLNFVFYDRYSDKSWSNISGEKSVRCVKKK